MPNRILRDWTDSEKMNEISSQAERFFTRLIMKADDFGCFHANPKLLKAALFPLKDDVRDIDVAKWLNECNRVGLLITYKVNDKNYLQILDFGQRLRASRSKFPQPHEDTRTIVSNSPSSAVTPPPETETRIGDESRETDADAVALTDEWFEKIFDDLTLDSYRVAYSHVDINDALSKFKIQVRGAPEDYRDRGTGGIRNAFLYQLRKIPRNGKRTSINQQVTTGRKDPTAETFGTL